MMGYKICFMEKYDYLSLNYPLYPFLSGALNFQKCAVHVHVFSVFLLSKLDHFFYFLIASLNDKTFKINGDNSIFAVIFHVCDFLFLPKSKKS